MLTVLGPSYCHRHVWETCGREWQPGLSPSKREFADERGKEAGSVHTVVGSPGRRTQSHVACCECRSHAGGLAAVRAAQVQAAGCTGSPGVPPGGHRATVWTGGLLLRESWCDDHQRTESSAITGVWLPPPPSCQGEQMFRADEQDSGRRRGTGTPSDGLEAAGLQRLVGPCRPSRVHLFKLRDVSVPSSWVGGRSLMCPSQAAMGHHPGAVADALGCDRVRRCPSQGHPRAGRRSEHWTAVTASFPGGEHLLSFLPAGKLRHRTVKSRARGHTAG